MDAATAVLGDTKIGLMNLQEWHAVPMLIAGDRGGGAAARRGESGADLGERAERAGEESCGECT